MAYKQKGFNAGVGTGTHPNKIDSSMMGSRTKGIRKAADRLSQVRQGKGRFQPGTEDQSLSPTARLNIGGKIYGENESPNQLGGAIVKGLKYGWKTGKSLFKKKPKVKVNTSKSTSGSNVPSTVKNTGTTSKIDLAKNKIPKGTPPSKTKQILKLVAGGVAFELAYQQIMGGSDDGAKGGDDKAIQDHVDNKNQKTSGGGDSGSSGSKTTTPKKDPYADAKKKDPSLDKHIAERDKHKKGSEEYNAAQNRINLAYGDKTRHGETDVTGTKGRDTISRKRTPGIGESAKLVRKRKIGGTKQIDQSVNYITGKAKEKKTKGDKEKERFYDAEGNLTRKTKDKKNKQKDVTKTDHTVTKVKINKRTGKVKTKTRRRRGKKTGEFFASLVGK